MQDTKTGSFLEKDILNVDNSGGSGSKDEEEVSGLDGSNVVDWWQDLSTKVAVWRNSIAHSVNTFLSESSSLSTTSNVASLRAAQATRTTTSNVWILGTKYDRTDQMQIWTHFRSIVWMTYRIDFPLINGTSFTNDIGWGCMIRSGQSMLAYALLVHFLGKNWRLGNEEFKEEIYKSVLNLFIDSDSHLLSIHRITQMGKERLSVDIGEWYGPSAIAQTLCELVNSDTDKIFHTDAPLKLFVAQDGCLYTEKIISLFDENPESSLLLLIPLRLGTSSLNPVYYDQLKMHLKEPTTVGICGGRPNAALYFIGVEADNLLNLDPHHPRPSLPSQSSYTLDEFLSYHCDVPRKTALNHVDPSLLLGHYFKSRFEFTAFCERFRNNRLDHLMFSILSNEPPFDDDFDMASVDSLEDE